MNGLSVRDLLSREFVGVSEGDSVRGAVELMRQDGEMGAVILRGTEPVGAISAADVLDSVAAGENLDETPVSSIMHRDPPQITGNASIEEALNHISKAKSDLLLVTNEEDVLGILTARDLTTVSWESSNVEEGFEQIAQSAEMGRETEPDRSYSNQSICEVCGSLSRDLMNVNGQLLCPDCRAV